MTEKSVSSEVFKEELRSFLLYASKEGYASGESERWKEEKDGSTTIEIQRGEFKMRDNFHGGEPFGGNMVVFYGERDVWMMVYYGRVDPLVKDCGSIYKFLQKALSKTPVEMPVRGPREFEDKDLTYENAWTGNLGGFRGDESIVNNRGRTVYSASYSGGWINMRKE